MQNGIQDEENISIWEYFNNERVFHYNIFSVLIIYQGLTIGGFSLKVELVVFAHELIIYEITFLLLGYVITIIIKTHGCVSAAKKAMWRTSVLFTVTPNSPFSTPRISIATGMIYIKFTNFMSSIYTTLHIYQIWKKSPP